MIESRQHLTYEEINKESYRVGGYSAQTSSKEEIVDCKRDGEDQVSNGEGQSHDGHPTGVLSHGPFTGIRHTALQH